MRRFYCVKCEKVKRVRKLPKVIFDALEYHPIDRIGVCNHHLDDSHARSTSLHALLNRGYSMVLIKEKAGR